MIGFQTTIPEIFPVLGINEANLDPLQWMQEKELHEVSTSVHVCSKLVAVGTPCLGTEE